MKKKAIKSHKKVKKAPKTKAAKKAPKTAPKASKKAFGTFEEWWKNVAFYEVHKIVKKWCKKNPPNESEEPEGDHWYVNRMMHDGEAEGMTYDLALVAWESTKNGKWEMSQDQSLYCELDEIIIKAHKAAL